MLTSIKIASFMLTSVKLFLSCYALHCFNCVSSLPSNISRDAQQAFKMILHSTYLVPPVDKLCADAQVYEFKMIKQISCSLGDQCVKISVWEKDLQFVIRGCQSMIYRNEVIGTNDIACRHDQSPSICRCNNNLCNGGSRMKFSTFTIFSAFLQFQNLHSFYNL